jgi:8-oxo-dGTP diphosphatase
MENFSTPVLVVALALLDGKGRVLMQRRPENKRHGGLWEFPGGKVEAGETPGSALVREIDEELAVVVSEDEIDPISFAAEELGASGRSLVLLLYGTRRWSGDPRAVEQGSQVRWVDAKELRVLDMPPLDIALARSVIRLLEGVAKAETAP